MNADSELREVILNETPWMACGPDERVRWLRRERDTILLALKDAVMMIDHANPGAWENGNTSPDGSLDEGTESAWRFAQSIRNIADRYEVYEEEEYDSDIPEEAY